jgi:hypothetical protein
VEFAEPPTLEPNPYLHDAPAILVQKLPVAPSEGDLLMQRADQAFQRGKKAYQATILDRRAGNSTRPST